MPRFSAYYHTEFATDGNTRLRTSDLWMVTILDLIYVALFAVAGPVFDYLFGWPAAKRRFQTDPTLARKRLYLDSLVQPWAVVAVGAAIWLYNDRDWTSLGFSLPDGWRLWVSIGFVLLLIIYLGNAIATVAGDSKTKANVREQTEKYGEVLPHTRRELYWFAGVSATAGFCEEFLFRGYFIWGLSSWLGWWGAAAVSLMIFATGHAYQGWNGILRTGIVGTIYTLIVAIVGSLWPAIVLHFIIDVGNGAIAWLALQEPTSAEEHVRRDDQTRSQTARETDSPVPTDQ